MLRTRALSVLVIVLLAAIAVQWPCSAPAQALPTASVTIGNRGSILLSCGEAPRIEDASFVVALAGTISQPVQVNLSWGGTAIAGTDYSTPPTSVTFAPGADEITVAIHLNVSAGLKTVVVTIESAAGYTVGDPGSATTDLIPLALPGCVDPPPAPPATTDPTFTG